MSRIFPLLAALGVFAPAVVAADAPLTQEVHELRRDLQMQGKKIEALSEQILRLTQLMETAKAPAVPAPPAAVTEIVKPAPEPAPAPAPEPEVAKAEAVPPPIKHTVEKGETLTSIAKHYNIPLPDLQKLNKITNDRKLQIGQTLNIPAVKVPETTAPAAPAEKKENP
jgi:LysM repeat protein